MFNKIIAKHIIIHKSMVILKCTNFFEHSTIRKLTKESFCEKVDITFLLNLNAAYGLL